MKKGGLLETVWKRCRIPFIDFVFIAVLISLGAILNLMLHILPHGYSKEQITLINTIQFWYSVTLMLIFAPFAIIHVIIERWIELRKSKK